MRPKIRWGTLPFGTALLIILGLPIALLLLAQMLAVWITVPGQFLEREDCFSLLQLIKLWGTTNPVGITGGTSNLQHWLIVIGFMAAVIILTTSFIMWRYQKSKNPQLRKGLAPVHEVEKYLGQKTLLKQGSRFRPSLTPSKIQPKDVGFKLGTFKGVEVWLRVEDPIIVVGPSRSGKGWYLVLNWLLDAPGAVITTSSKMDNAMLTLEARKRGNRRVWVFAPGVDGGDSLGHVLKWNPIQGCEDEKVLMRRIKSLIPSDAFSGSSSNGGHWDTLGQQLASHLFHAAACAGESVDTVWSWVANPQRAMEAVKIIREHPQGLKEHADHLENVINMPPEQRGSSWGTLNTVLAFMESRAARDWMKPDQDSVFDPVRFVFEKETLYLVGDKQTTGGYVRIIDGLLAEMDYVTKGIADASPGSRLDPPITYLLDEAGNFEYQGLYELITAGGGRGRVVVAVFQSQGQLSQWGEANADTMWDAAVAKIILPGGSKQKDLTEMEGLIGSLWVQRDSHSWNGQHTSVQVGEEKRAIMESKDIRQLENSYALLFYRNMSAIIPKMTPFNKHSRYAECEANAKRLAPQVASKSEFAEAMKKYHNA